jgi:hypothetical protein
VSGLWEETSQALIRELPIFLGVLTSVVAGGLLVGDLNRLMWDLVPNQAVHPDRASFSWKAPLLGWVERAIYYFSLSSRKPEIIGFWLILKVAGRWKGPDSGSACWKETWYREKAFEVYVIGNGLSIGVAAAGWQLTQFLAGRNYPETGLLVLWVLVVWATIRSHLTRRRKTSAKQHPGSGG